MICVYFICGVSTNTGIGDISPGRYIEIVFLIILMLTAKFMIGNEQILKIFNFL